MTKKAKRLENSSGDRELIVEAGVLISTN